jgi:hypothetical protein
MAYCITTILRKSHCLTPLCGPVTRRSNRFQLDLSPTSNSLRGGDGDRGIVPSTESNPSRVSYQRNKLIEGRPVEGCHHTLPAAFSAMKWLWIFLGVNFEAKMPAWIFESMDPGQQLPDLAFAAWINPSNFTKSTNFAPR